jgi:hypothetical protein
VISTCEKVTVMTIETMPKVDKIKYI